MIRRTRYVIAVNDLAASAAFYRDILGFAIIEVGDPGWLFFERDACLIMAGECPDATPARDLGDHSYFAYLEVDEIDEFHESVVTKNAMVVKSIRSEPWGMREFGICTVDGHRIMFGAPIAKPGT